MKLLRSSFWMSSFFYTFLQRFSLVFLGAVSFIILVHAVPPENFANWALFTIVVSTIEMVKSGLLRNAVIKFLAITPTEEKSAVSSSALWMNALVTVLVILLIMFLREPAGTWLKARMLPMLLLAAIPMLMSLVVFSHYEMLLQSIFRFDIIFKANFIRPFVQFAGLSVLYVLWRPGLTLLNALFFQTAGVILGTVYMYWQGRQYFPIDFTLNFPMIRRMFAFGKYTAATNLVAQTSRSFDHLLTAYLLPPAVSGIYVSYYNVVTRISNMIDVPSLAVADVVYPKNVQALEQEGIGKVRYYFEQVSGTVLAIMLPVSLVLFLFPSAALQIIGGGNYEPAAGILRISLIVGMIRPFTYLFGSLMDSIGRPRQNFYVNLFLLFTSFFLNALFITDFRGMGAAYAMPFQYAITLIVMYTMLRRTIGFRPRGVWEGFRRSYSRALSVIRKRPS